jgi:hypothetical protein
MRRRITTSVGAEEPVEGIMQAVFFLHEVPRQPL